MPRRAMKACPKPGCPGVFRPPDGKCNVCGYKRPKRTWPDRGKTTERGYGADWRRIRAQKLKQTPLCEQCAVEGRVVVATDVDHIVPFMGTDDPLRLSLMNLRSLCRRCHQIKTARQGRRARRVGG